MTKVPIELRSHERAQLDEFITRVVDILTERGLSNEAEEVENVDLIENGNGTFSAEPSEWATVVGGLRHLRDDEGLRTWWLRSKLAKRLNERISEIEAEEEADDDVTPTVEAEETPSQPTAA